MRTNITTLLCSLALCTGCMGVLSETGEGVAPDPTTDPTTTPEGEWALSIDTSPSDSYIDSTVDTATIRGVVTASEGVRHVEVGPADAASRVPADSGGSFETPMSVGPGYSLVEVRATDRADHVVDGHVSLLRADYVPQWELLGDSAVIAADESMLSALGDGAAGALGGLDLSAFVTPGSTLMDNEQCRLFVDGVSHGTPTLTLTPTDDGRLRATATVADIAVGFYGVCNALGNTIGVDRGSEADETTVQLSMIIEPIPPAPGECVSGFTSSDVSLRITEFDLDLRLSGCGLLCLAGELVGEIAEGAVKGMIEDQFMEMVGGLVDPLLADLEVLNETTTLDFLDTPVEVGLCLTGLEPSPEGQLMARIGTRARSMGPELGPSGPGAPVLATGAGVSRPGTMLLDPGLISQILYAVWNGGALAIPDVSALSEGEEGLGFTVDTLASLVRELRPFIEDGRITRGAPLVIGVDANMAPLARAATPEEAAGGVDMFIEIGDLRLSIGTGSMTLFEIATHVQLALSLEPTPEGALAPVLVEDQSTSVTWLVDTAVPMLSNRSAASLVDLVDGLIISQLSPLLSGTAIELPDLGVPLTVGNIEPLTDGYLEVELAVGEPMPAPPPAP